MRRQSTILSIALFTLSSLAFAGDAPVVYNAISDNAVRPQPPTPALGAAGTVIVDATFGSKILRVTDGNTLPQYRNSGFLTPAGSFEVNWNSDTTLFWIHSKAGPILFRFDGAALRATAVPDPANAAQPLVLPGSGPFSFRKPNILYMTRGRKVAEYDVNTRALTTVFDGNVAVPSAANYAYAPSVSDDDNRICLAFGGQQDTHPYVAVLDRSTGRYTVLDTKASRLNGAPTNIWLGFGLHSAYMDRSGRYVIMAKGQGKIAGTSDWVVWDVDASRVYEITAEWSGHDAAGFGTRVNQSGFYGGVPAFYEEQQWATRGLSESQINKYSYVLDWTQLPSPHQYIYSGHHSWNNARPDAMVPVVGSIVRDSSQTSLPWRMWDNEIIGIATDGSKKVYRFAHHYSKWDRSNFWDDPRGNISQDGRFFVFTSNWDRTLGADPWGGVRHDVFIVALPADGAAAASSDTTKPTVAVTAPANGANISGVVTLAANATDDKGVSAVEFRVNGALVGTDTTVPYAAAWDSKGVANGQYTVSAVARDAAGNTATSAITISVNNPVADTGAPVVVLTSPVTGTTSLGGLTLAANATDSNGIARVEFLANGAVVRTELYEPYLVGWTMPSYGTWTIVARAFDNAGNQATSAPVTVTYSALVQVVTPPNLLLNPGFEQGTTAWAFFDHPRRAVVSSPVHSGSKAASVGIASSFYSTVEQVVAVQAGRTYKASTWLKQNQIGGSRGSGIMLFWLDSSGRQLREDSVTLIGTRDWTLMERNFTAPTGAVRVKFELWSFTDPDDWGTTWFDDASLSMVQ